MIHIVPTKVFNRFQFHIRGAKVAPTSFGRIWHVVAVGSLLIPIVEALFFRMDVGNRRVVMIEWNPDRTALLVIPIDPQHANLQRQFNVENQFEGLAEFVALMQARLPHVPF